MILKWLIFNQKIKSNIAREECKWEPMQQFEGLQKHEN